MLFAGRQLNVLKRRLSVRESATEVSGKLVFGTPKSHPARTVVIPAFLADDTELRQRV